MLDHNAILDANDIRCNPVHRLAEPRKSPMHDYEISFSHDRSRFIFERWRNALDKIEETVATRCDMSAVLNVVGRPISLSCYVVALIEQRVESFEDECFIFRFNCL